MNTIHLARHRLDEAKRRVGLSAFARSAGLGEIKPNGVQRSPLREDRHDSFSATDDRLWKDHATGEGGDVVSFIARATGCDTCEAIKHLLRLAGLDRNEPLPPVRLAPRPVTPPPEPKPTPPADLAVYDEGVAHLQSNEAACAEIDQWRGYRPGTIAALAESGTVSAPRRRGQRCHAFAVVTADGMEIGFHARHPAKNGERPSWSYHPRGISSLPFVLGSATAARRVIVTEGQWDAIALASAVGWLRHDSAWNVSTLLLGARGAGGVKPILDHYLPRVPPSAEWILFRDADAAG